MNCSNFPAGIAEPAYRSLAHLFGDMACRHAERPAVASLGQVLNYARLEELSRHFAAFLTAGLGLEPGARIALMLPNILQQPVAFWGALRAGLVVVNTNPLYTARELEYQLRDSGASSLVALDSFSPVLGEVLPRLRIETVILSHFGDLLAFPKNWLANWRTRPERPLSGAIPFLDALHTGRGLSFRSPEPGPGDLALIQYTGGTTGTARGAMLSHRNLLVNVEQCTAWLRSGFHDGRRFIEGEETVFIVLPLYHIFALTVCLLGFTRLGSLCHLIANPRDLPRLVKELGQVRPTAFAAVNTLFKKLLASPGFAELDFSALKFTISGGMATEESVARQWLATTGVPITEGYGLTEASPVVTINPPAALEFTGSIGLPLPATECGIRDEQGALLPTGMAGELWVRGPQVMRGYWNQAEATAAVLDAEGWLRTGDIARRDEQGFLYLVDRKKDMILVSGFNVYPSEIEAVLGTHPAVRECAAIGVPDAVSGEAVKVFVARASPDLDEAAVKSWCHQNLAAYKVPTQVEFLEELPKSPIGKVLRRALRAGS